MQMDAHPQRHLPKTETTDKNKTDKHAKVTHTKWIPIRHTLVTADHTQDSERRRVRSKSVQWHLQGLHCDSKAVVGQQRKFEVAALNKCISLMGNAAIFLYQLTTFLGCRD